MITADTSGLFKLWDLRNFQCVQSFTSEHEPGDLDDLTGTLNCFAHVKLPSRNARLDEQDELDDFRIVAASKKMLFFDQERVRQDPVSDDGPIRIACYNDDSLTIFTTSERTAKVWDAILGSIKRLFRNVTSSDISAACLDDRKRKFILGEVSGCVTVFNYRNGARMKCFLEQGTSPVVNLVYCAATKSVLAAYTDGIIRVYDENDIEACRVLRTFEEAYRHAGDLQCVSYLPKGTVVASGGNDHNDGVRLWDHDTGKCDMIMKIGKYEVLVMKFLDPYPLLAVCSSDSKVRIWGACHSLFKGTCVAEFTNEIPEDALVSESQREAVIPNDDNDAGSMPIDCVQLEADRKKRARKSLLYITKRKLGQAMKANEVPPDFVQPEHRNTSPVCRLSWDAIDECVYTGDEGGHLRKWCIKLVLGKLDTGILVSEYTGGRRRVTVEGGNGNMTVEQAASLSSPSGCEATSALVRFKWGMEAAHDGDITVVELTKEPRGILTASTDRCVKMWNLAGRCMGLLLQGIKRGIQNPRWELDIDVASRVAKENESVLSVMRAVAKQKESSAVFGLEKNRQRKNSGNRQRRQAPQSSPQLRSTLPPEMQEDHERILDVLSNVKSMHVHTDVESIEDSKSSGSSFLVGDPKLREKNRRLPPYLKFDDPMSHSPIELTSMGVGFERSDEEIQSHSSNRQRLPQIRPARSFQFQKSPSIVPPALSLPGKLDDNVRASIDRLSVELDGLEKDTSGGIFKGKRSTVDDFIGRYDN